VKRALALAAVLICLLPRPAAAQPLEESQVKAAFLFNFAKFVQWPSGAERPLVMGVAGDERLAEVLQALVRGRTFDGRTFVVRAMRHADDPAGCDLLYIAPSREREDAGMLQRTQGAVLTVGETVRFLRDGGMVRLFRDDSRLRFQIDAKTAHATGLRIHAQLLSLAAK
jgi:hypothetical protein